MRLWPAVIRLIDMAPNAKPAPEKISMVRALGQWHAIRGEWQQALQHFDYVQRAAQLDHQEPDALDYLNKGIALLEIGDEAGFLSLRNDAIRVFKDSTNSDDDLRVLELGLLRHVSKTSAGDLEPFAQILARKLADDSQIQNGNNSSDSWNTMLLGLLEYRRGNPSKSLDWCRRSLNASEFVFLPTAIDYEIEAMCFTSGRIWLRSQSFSVRVIHGLNSDFDRWFWHEWLCARLLLKEATDLLANAPNQTNSPAQ